MMTHKLHLMLRKPVLSDDTRLRFPLRSLKSLSDQNDASDSMRMSRYA
jgi:hypothetical protein